MRFKTLKSEMAYQQTFQSRLVAKQAVFEYVEIRHNRQRRHSAMGYLSPVEYYSGQCQHVALRFVQCFVASLVDTGCE
ncbi:IS3 family transposase [uncultured Spirosoma sp.]|uniref:IS3 family transposase n=1 Tax=uncultured Spirosoma sp. TaxID=278208 RepID=UPI0033901ABA